MAETLTAGEALIELRATSDKLSADMAAASKLITGELAKVEKSSASIDLSKVFKDGLAAAAAFAGGVGVVATAATQLALSSVKTGDEINRMSQAFGISAEELSGLKMAAEDVDVSFGQLQVGLKTLANQISDAASNATGPAAETFKALGIAVTDATGALRPTGDVLADVADEMAGMQDGAGKTAIATQLLGRSGQDLIPVLNGGSEALARAAEEARGLGVAFSSETAAAAAALDDQLDKLGHQIGGVANEIGQALMPTVSAVVGEVSEWIEQNRTLLGQSIDQWATGVKVAIDTLLPPLAAAAKGFKELGESMFGSGLSSLGELEAEEAKLIARTNELKGAIDSTTVVNQYNAEMVAHLKDEYANLSTQLAGVQNRIKSAKGETVAGAAAFKQLDGATTGAGKAAGNAANNLGKLPPPIIKTGDAAKKTADANEKLQQSIEQLKLDALSDDLDDATAALERNRSVVADESYLRALQDIQAAYESQVETIKRTTEEAVAAGADRTLAAEREALAVESAQRDMAQAVEKLDGVLVKNADYWGDVGKVVADLPPEMRALIPTLDAVALATGNVSEATKEAATDLVKLDGIASDLAKGLAQAITRSADWRGVGDAILAKTLDATFTQGIEDALNDTFIKAISEITDPVSDAMSTMFKSAFNAIADPLKEFGGEAFAAIFGDAIKDGVAGASSFAASAAAFLPVAGAAYGGLALAFGNKNVGKEASMAIAGEVGAMVSVGAAVGIGAALGTPLGPVGVAIGAGVGFIAGALASAFGVDRPDMRERIATEVEKQIGKALAEDVNYQAVLDAGLAPLGYELTAATARSLINASRSNDLLRAQAESLGETYGADFMAGFSPAFTASVNKHGASSTEVPVSDWVRAFFPDSDAAAQAYATELAKSLASVEVASMGLTGADAVTMTEQIAAGYVNLAQSTGMSIDEFVEWMETSNQAAGMSTQFFASLDALNAKMMDSGVSMDTVNGKLSQFTGMDLSGAGNLVDLFIASGESANVFVKQLEKIGDSDPALRRLIDSMDPPLVDALHNVEMGAEGAAAAFRDLVGTVAADLANVVDAANLLIGDVSFRALNEQLDSLKTQLANTDDDAKAKALSDQIAAIEKQLDGLSPKVDVINEQIQDSLRSLASAAEEDGQLTVDEFSSMLSELQILATLPAGSVSDSTQALIDQIIAQFQVALKLTDEQVSDLRAQIEAGGPIIPPDALTAPVDQAALDAAAEATGNVAENSAAAATAADDLTSSTQATGAAAGDTAAAFEDLATRALAALGSLIGTVGDDAGLLSIEDLIRVRIPEALAEAEAATLGATGVIHDSFDYARGAVLMLTDAINAIPTEKTITVTVNQVGGTSIETTPDPGPGMAAGGWIPGLPSDPYPITAHGGELVVPEATASTLPPDLVARLLSGSAFDLPASMVSRLSYPVGVPSMASVAGAGAAPSTPALDSEWTALPVRKRDLIEGAVLEVARATETGRARIDGRRFRVSPTYGSRR